MKVYVAPARSMYWYSTKSSRLIPVAVAFARFATAGLASHSYVTPVLAAPVGSRALPSSLIRSFVFSLAAGRRATETSGRTPSSRCTLRVTGKNVAIKSIRGEIIQRLRKEIPTMHGVLWEYDDDDESA